MEKLLKLAKQSLSIGENATLKDKEIKMLIRAGIADLKRLGINASKHTKEDLIQTAIIMFVKSKFGNTDIKEKELAEISYNHICQSLSLSSEYKMKEEDSNV